MLSVTSKFTAAEKSDVNQIASKVYLVLGNYASSSAYGATVSASSTDSSDYPASGAIDGDRTELNVGPASGADNDVGQSSWRSSTVPSVTPQTLTIDFGTSRTVNRIKLYHLSSHGLKSYKFESSPDNVTYTLISKTTDQGGTITTTGQLDTIDFSDTTCRYIKLTVSDTQVGADKANVVEVECYRKVDITDRVTSAHVNRSRDYKLQNPLASTFTLSCDNSDKFFSFSHTASSSEVSSGFVNSELQPNVGVIIQYGFAYGGGMPEVATVFNGFIDRISINSAQRTAQIEGRDFMKPLINQIVSSKLKTSQDIKACIQYALNLANISTWEMSLDSTSLTVDYFFINNQSVITVIRDLVQASADAAFWFDESGIGTFKYYVNSTPQIHTDSSESDFEAGTVLTNIDTISTPGQFSRKWFLVDDFADSNYNSNPVWTNRISASTYTDDAESDFESGSVLTNVSTTSVPGSIRRKWFKVDDFADGDYSSNPAWTVADGTYSTFSPIPTNYWLVSSNQLEFAPGSTGVMGRASIPFSPVVGTWEIQFQMNHAAGASTDYLDFFFMANSLWNTNGAKYDLYNGYVIRIDRNAGTLSIQRDDIFARTSGGSASVSIGTSLHTIRVTRATNGDMSVYYDGSIVTFFNPFPYTIVNDTTYTTSAYLGVRAQSSAATPAFLFDNFYYSVDLDGTTTASAVQTVFESRIFDQSSAITAEGSITVSSSTPAGTSISVYTATSNDGSSWDSYIAVSGGLIQSTAKRYIKYKILFVSPNETINTNLTTAQVDSVTFQYTTVGWQVVSSALKYAPLTTATIAGIDTSFAPITGTWRANFKMTIGTASGEKARMYVVSTGYDATLKTFPAGYYAELDQAAGTIRICKITAAGVRSTLTSALKTITSGTTYSVRLTRTSAGVLTLFWNEVQACTTTDTTFSTTALFGLEVDPNSDHNGSTVIDDIYYSPQVDGTGSISTSQSVFESQVIDMTASIASLGLFQATTNTPTGTSIAYYTATSTDNVTYDAYIAATPGSAIPSSVKRYLKWKVVLTSLIDDGNHNANVTAPSILDVTINWFVGTGTTKFPTSVSYTFRFDTTLLDITQEYADNLGGDTAIINDVNVQAKPLYLSGNDTDVQWQGTTQTPPVAISGSAPLAVSAAQVLTYQIVIPSGMDTSRMSGASPAAASITAPAGTTWSFTTIHPTRPVLKITIGGTPGNITALQVQGKSFTNSTTGAIQNSKDLPSIRLYGDRQQSISNTYIVNNAIASSIASKLVANSKNPTSYIPQITVRPTFSAQLNDRVTIVDDNTDISADYVIAGIQHELTANVTGGQSQTDLLLLKVTS